MTQEALKLVLEALEYHTAQTRPIHQTDEAITAIKEALAQEQEPVAWQFFEGGKWHNGMEVNDHRKHTEAAGVPVRDLYTTPPQRTEQNFCSRCGKRTTDLTTIHTCTPPQRTERPADCERCNRLEEHAYDLVGKLRVANIKLSMQSKACVYCGQLVAKEKK